MAAGRTAAGGRAAGLAAVLGLILGTFLAYGPVKDCGFIWDDDAYVTDNKVLDRPGGLGEVWFRVGATPQYYPLVFTTFWIEQRLWGDRPLGYHLVNVALHGLSAVLLWRILRRLGLPGAWLAAAVFAVHPVHVESVAWVTERKNVLSGVFYFASLACYLRYRGIEEVPPAEARRPSALSPRVAYGCCLLFFACALLSKSVTASLPAVILLILWWKRRLTRQDALAIAPLFVLGLSMGLHTAWLEREHVGAKGPEWDLTAIERVLVAGRAVWFYAGKLVWPVDLTFIYPRWKVSAAAWWQYLFPLSAVGLLAGLFLCRRRIGRGPLVAALVFGGTLVPAIGFFNVYPFRYSFVADHFQYLASIALVALVIGVAAWGLRSRMQIAVPAALLMLVTLGALTWRQVPVYRNMETLWTDTIRKNAEAWMAHGNLGDYLSGRGRTDEAIAQYEKSLALKPDSPQLVFNLGLALGAKGRRKEALARYQEALGLQPKYPQAWVNIGCIHLDEGRLDEAVAHFREAFKQDSNLAEAHYNLANALSQQRLLPDAVVHYREAIRCRPDYAEAWINLGNALLATKRIDEGIDAYRRAIAVRPGAFEARLNLGALLLERGQLREALDHLGWAVRIRPDSPDARYRLGKALERSGHTAEAIGEFQAVLRLDPTHPAGADLDRLRGASTAPETGLAPGKP